MNNFTRISIVVMILLLNSCHSRVDSARESERLLATDREFSARSVEVGAADAFHLFLADEAIQLPAQSEPISGKEDIVAKMKEEGGRYTLKWVPRKAEVAASGDLGYTWGTYTLAQRDDHDSMKASYGKYVNVWKRMDDGSWKVLVDIGNQSPVPEHE